MKRKSVAGVLTVALIGTMLSGCGAKEDAAGESISGAPEVSVSGTELAEGAGVQADDGVVTLTVWAEEANFELLNQMIDSFKEEYAGQAEFDIQLVDKADADTKNNLLGDIHNGADVFPMPDDQLTSMVAAGALMPVPNADEIREANLDEEDVMTMDGLLAVAEANGKKVTMDWSSGWYLYAFFGNTGLDFGVNEDGVTNYCDWNSTEGSIKGVDVAEAMLAIANHPGFLAGTDDVFLAGVQDGSVIAGVSGVWNAAEIKAAWGDNYGAVKLPTYTCAGQQVQMASFTGYKMLGVNAYSAHPEWALKLADWMTNEENQTLRLMERGSGPSNKNAAASEEVKNVPAIQAVIDQAQYGRLQRVGNSYWTPTQNFGNTMAAGNPTGTDLQELMDTLVSGITASVTQ